MQNDFHGDTWALENAGAGSDAHWIYWCRKVEALLGITSLDGDQGEDGYSLDWAFASYEKDATPEAYAETVHVNRRLMSLPPLPGAPGAGPVVFFEGQKFGFEEGIKHVADAMWARHPNNPANKGGR